MSSHITRVGIAGILTTPVGTLFGIESVGRVTRLQAMSTPANFLFHTYSSAIAIMASVSPSTFVDKGIKFGTDGWRGIIAADFAAFCPPTLLATRLK